MKKITNALGPLLILAGAAFAVAEEEPPFLPPSHPIERYERIWTRSPFVVETKLVEESAGLAQRFALTGVAMISGSPVAMLLDRSSLARIMVGAGRESQGIELVSVDQQSNVRNSSAVIKLGAEQASLRFDADTLTTVNTPAEIPHTAVPVPAGAQVQPNPQTNPAEINPPPRPNTPTRVIRRTLIQPRQ